MTVHKTSRFSICQRSLHTLIYQGTSLSDIKSQSGIGTAADCPIYNQSVRAVDDQGKIQLTFWKSERRNICQSDYRQDPSHRPEVAVAATGDHLHCSFLPCSQ